MAVIERLGQRDPVLRDGTRFSELWNPDRYEVSRRLLSDPEVYRLELETLFGRNWVMLGHESEVPNPGDYVMRHIGEDPVILTRSSDGELNVLLNVCTHRGMMICRSEGGKGTQFKCPYHGFTFTNTGRFLGAPAAHEQMWGDTPKEEYGLRRARVETYVGMVFANWDENAPSLDEWLGDMKWYLDLMYARSPEGLEVLGPPQRFTIHANWKCAAEQAAMDAYHTLTLHQSLVELDQTTGGGDDKAGAAFLYGFDVSANGHSVHCMDSREPYRSSPSGQDELGDVDVGAAVDPAAGGDDSRAGAAAVGALRRGYAAHADGLHPGAWRPVPQRRAVLGRLSRFRRARCRRFSRGTRSFPRASTSSSS